MLLSALTDEELIRYIESGTPIDKAAAFSEVFKRFKEVGTREYDRGHEDGYEQAQDEYYEVQA